MKLCEIKNRISSLPTIMGISSELILIDELMNIEINEIIANGDVFCSIVEQIELSHTDSGFMELTRENEGEFIKFYHWLSELKAEYNLKLNSNLIESFSLTFDRIVELMS